MPKNGLDHVSAKGILHAASKAGGWALCVGAGTSCCKKGFLSPFPLWKDLAFELARSVDSTLTVSPKVAPDALISAAFNRISITEEEFAERLANILYTNMREKIAGDWDEFARCLSERDPGALARDVFERFLKVVELHYPTLTSLALARVLSRVWPTECRPACILSFNAEPMLAALLNAFTVRRGTSMRTEIDWVTRGSSKRYADRVPYYFCHGLLPVPDGRKRAQTRSQDKLVFREEDYLRLANLNHAWQGSTFMAACTAHTVLFVGHSLTDPNIRRWLAWLHQARLEDIKILNKGRSTEFESTKHFWICVRDPHTSTEWMEASVSHLGLRIIWINAWNELSSLIEGMLSVV